MSIDSPEPIVSNDRDEAIRRLTAKRHLVQSGVSFVSVSLVLVVIWAISGAGEFWPIFPILAFAFAFATQAVAMYTHKGITEEDVQKEMQKGG